MKKKKLSADLLLLCLLLVCGLVIGAIVLLQGLAKPSAKVIVSVNGTETASFALTETVEYVIHGYDDGHNTLIVQDGKAFVKDADCADKICEGMGEINMNGQSIICLPNRVVVEVVGGEEQKPTGRR